MVFFISRPPELLFCLRLLVAELLLQLF
jgi:hypothetical protein